MMTLDAGNTSPPHATMHVSAPLTLAISGISDGDSRVTPPAVTQANGSVIDLGAFEGDATVAVTAWPLMAIGQTSLHGHVTYTVKGVNTPDNPVTSVEQLLDIDPRGVCPSRSRR